MWKLRPYDKAKEEQLIKSGKSKLMARLLAQRNIETDHVDKFIASEYQNISSPFSLAGVEKAAKVFVEAIKNKWKILSSGDYDVDGILSSVMIKELCNAVGLECQFFLPSRLEHGYGLGQKTIAALIEKMAKKNYKPDLLIVLDCGSNSYNEIEQLKQHIPHVIVIDHHLLDKTHAPNVDALVSWHLGGTCEMCTCGEVYQFIRGVYQLTGNKAINPIEYLTLSAIGTVADVMPIVSDNRIIVKNGLTSYAINHVVSSGLTALLKASNINAPVLTQMDVSFKIAPKINAAGRIDEPDIIYGLFTERDPDMALKIANFVGTYNDERKELQKKIEGEAITQVEAAEEKFTHGILVRDDWHVGVVGIVASKLTEKFYKPALVIGNNNGIWKGSGRSVKGVNLKAILDMCPEIFEGYGGHEAAVGVTLKNDSLETAADVFNAACKKYYELNKISFEECNFFDAKVNAQLINPKTAEVFTDSLYPYCDENNAEPVFMLPDALIHNTSINQGKGWRLLTFHASRDIDIPYPFKVFGHKFGQALEGRKADIFFSFCQIPEKPRNQYETFELMVKDIVLKN